MNQQNWMTTENTPREQRYYLRCHDCLVTTCIELSGPRGDIKCGICGGNMDMLGSVVGESRWQHRAEVCVCNEICQTARGRKCTCSCGGENHGKGYRYYTYIDAQGRINVTPHDDHDKCLCIAKEYRVAEAEAVKRINSLPRKQEYDCGKYIDRESWLRIHDAIEALNVARKGSQHKSRMSKLAKVAA